MRKLFLITILVNSLLLSAQEFDTNYIRGKSSTFCAEENFSFSFNNKTYKKTDSYNGNETYGYSKVVETNYDNNGYYYEIRNALFILEEYGITEYKKHIRYSHKIVYEKRGGEILYIFEYDDQNGIDRGKFYFTKKGYEIYCK